MKLYKLENKSSMKNLWAVLIVLISFASFFSSCRESEEIIYATEKELLEAVYASGSTASEGEYQVTAMAEGFLTEKHVQEGDTVKKGQLLFVVVSDQQKSRYQLATEAYRIAKENNSAQSHILNELEAVIASVKSKLSYDSTNYLRYKNLLEQNATTKAEYERIKLAYENTSNELRAHQSKLARTKSQLFLELQQAESQLRTAREESTHYTISSKIDGVVFNTTKEPGELVRRAEPLALIGQLENFFIRLSVDELDIQRLQIGQSVLVKIDAYPNQVFNASVSKIYPLVNAREQSIRVDAKFVDAFPGYYNGLALEANIIIQQKEKALVIPKKALQSGDSLLIKTDQGNKKIKINKGIETLDEVEILEGLSKETAIILSN
jgi:HlyD family secretion protein